MASCKEEPDQAPASRAGSAAPSTVPARLPMDQQDEVTSPMRKRRGTPTPRDSPRPCPTLPVIIVSDSEEERERMSQEA